MIETADSEFDMAETPSSYEKKAFQPSQADIEIKNYLESMPHFNMLPPNDVNQMAVRTTPKKYTAGEQLAVQDLTQLDHIFVIRRGKISIHNSQGGEEKLVGHIVDGEIFGGISVLMNNRISLRTVYVEQETEAYLIPQEIFLDLCSRHPNFSSFFAENFSSHIRDAGLDTIINSGLTRIFLSSIAPFSFLPDSAIEDVVKSISMVRHTKDSFLFMQGKTKVSHLYILQKGAAKSYYDHNGNETLQEFLGEGDIYGGISMLLNESYSVRTLEVTEETYFYLLPRSVFISLCQAHAVFRDFFTDTFGKRMLDKSYAAIIARTSAGSDDALQLFNIPVKQICNHNTVVGTADMSIQQVAKRMEEENSSYLILPAEMPHPSGIITESDLAKKVVAAGYDIGKSAKEVMSIPLHTINEDAMVFEALMKMIQHNVKHLAVENSKNSIIGILSNSELLAAQQQSPLLLLGEISKADSIDHIMELHEKLPGIVKRLINSGAVARNVNRMITTISDAILQRIMDLTLKDMGPPPTNFAFIILGSEGRGEQTLKTDQDNAIIFEDVSEAEFPAASDYFLKLGQEVCKRLNAVGYDYCKGDVMAQNPNWCQPLSTWMKYFLNWVHASEPEDLLNSSIFFDFRFGYGDSYLVDALQDHLFGVINKWAGFLRYMVENALYFKPPLGFFRNFVVASKGEHRDSLDLKSAMTPIVDFARIYALKNNIQATNTLERLEQLYLKKVLTHQQYEELEKAYSFLMQMRIARQINVSANAKKPPDNYINPKRMTRIEQKMLKEIFKRIGNFQSKMSLEFTGIA